jgi:membrane protein involved in colicin uptake
VSIVLCCVCKQEEARARAEAQAKAQAEARRKQEARAAAAEAARKKQEAARGGSTKIGSTIFGRGTSTVVARGGSTANDAAKRKQVRLSTGKLLFWKWVLTYKMDFPFY